MPVEQRLDLLALRLAHRVPADALCGGLVLLAREGLDLDAELVEHRLQVVGLGREPEQRDRRLWREEDPIGGRGDVELAVTPAAGQ